jgi:hypothetical protein
VTMHPLLRVFIAVTLSFATANSADDCLANVDPQKAPNPKLVSEAMRVGKKDRHRV